jgi:glycosyltransferase involved in cell wall biosynthesis
MRILCIGPLWRGSNAGGLFKALSRKGCMIEVVDEFYFVSLNTKNKVTKVLERIIRPRQVEEFNNNIKNKIKLFKPDVILVYKGTFVMAETLIYAKEYNCKLALFFPDVSTTAHGPYIPACIPYYEQIFTTKTFGIKDMGEKYGVKNMQFIPHGYDPEIHRIIPITDKELSIFGNDASFIGTWSPKKEKWLSYIKENIPGIDLKIWGGQWSKSTSAILKDSIQGTEILGDLYAMAIQCSKINLGILSEQRIGSSSGDLITSRTFHIPGAGGFMLHERNEESLNCFVENEEAAFFDGPEEMVAQIKRFLPDAETRDAIRMAGHRRALAEHSLDARAQTVMNYLNKM